MNAQLTSLQPLVALCHHRWSVPLIAALHRLAGAKFITLVNRLQISRDSLSRTLTALLEEGWAQRNPGYGHPLRPEYVLTPKGQEVGAACSALLGALQGLDVEETALCKWSLPVVRCLGAGPVRFGQLKARLSGITARALAQTLKQLEGARLVERTDVTLKSPQPRYRLTRRARLLGSALKALCTTLDLSCRFETHLPGCRRRSRRRRPPT